MKQVQGRTGPEPLELRRAERVRERQRLGRAVRVADNAILSACNAAGFSPRVGQEAPRIVSTLNLVAAGLGISLVPESLQRMHLDGVVFRRVAGAAQPKASLYLAARRDVGGGPELSGIGQAARARRIDRRRQFRSPYEPEPTFSKLTTIGSWARTGLRS